MSFHSPCRTSRDQRPFNSGLAFGKAELAQSLATDSKNHVYKLVELVGSSDKRVSRTPSRKLSLARRRPSEKYAGLR